MKATPKAPPIAQMHQYGIDEGIEIKLAIYTRITINRDKTAEYPPPLNVKVLNTTRYVAGEFNREDYTCKELPTKFKRALSLSSSMLMRCLPRSVL